MFSYIPTSPTIQFKHVDGPYITFSDGQMHWLTWKERFLVWIGKLDRWRLQDLYRPDLRRITRALFWEEENL